MDTSKKEYDSCNWQEGRKKYSVYLGNIKNKVGSNPRNRINLIVSSECPSKTFQSILYTEPNPTPTTPPLLTLNLPYPFLKPLSYLS